MTLKFQEPVMPSLVLAGSTPVSCRMAFTRLSGIRMWLATTALS